MAQTLEHNKAVTEVVPVTLPEFDADLDFIQKLDDEPNDVGGLTPAELKAKFDAAGAEVKDYINGTLLPAVISEELTETTRRNAEAERVNNEVERAGNEEDRIKNENARIEREGKILEDAESLVHGGTGTREGEDEDNAAYYAWRTSEDAAKTAADAAAAEMYMNTALAAVQNGFAFGTEDIVNGESTLAQGVCYLTIYKA